MNKKGLGLFLILIVIIIVALILWFGVSSFINIDVSIGSDDNDDAGDNSDSDILDSNDVDSSSSNGVGSLTVLSNSCGGTESDLPNTECMEVKVECPGVPDITGKVRITEPPAGKDVKGTIVFATGSEGKGWWEGRSGSFPNDIMLKLSQDDRYRLIQRAWESAWQTGTGGTGALACRYATILHWASDTYQESGSALCATGNSGGAGEISYALTRYGGDEILDHAIMTGGPPFTRLDLACGMDPTWVDTCINDVWTKVDTNCVLHEEDLVRYCEKTGTASIIDLGFPENNNACENKDSSVVGIFLEASALSSDADITYPNTKVDFIEGTEDCTSAIPNGVLYYDAIKDIPGNDVSWEMAIGAPHSVHTSETGTAAIYDAFIEDCTPRH